MDPNRFPVVDSHFHMWDLKRFDYKWPRKEEEEKIFKDFVAIDYDNERKKSGIDYSVFVEVVETLEETRWALKLAETHPFIVGVVGYVDLTSSEVESQIGEFRSNPKFVGVRKILPFCEDGWLERDDVINGMRALAKHNLTFDLLLRTRSDFDSAKRLLQRLATNNLRLVVDHLGKPNAVSGADQQWYDDMVTIASYPNVYCKISGMVTEADLENWKPEDFKQHVDHVIKCFGVDRVMFGSDWPVCKMAGADLCDVKVLLEGLVGSFSSENRRKLFGENAIRFYRLQV